ncbi:hypothetical protein [Collimonas silvisoli]|uniref:hypothetical protein n=1 Tax=Collimonas silvisoli TaxID=2825884 RepID=UPI001B8AAA7E|nr:hypothetical protein [Collimonas silvisoli]
MTRGIYLAFLLLLVSSTSVQAQMKLLSDEDLNDCGVMMGKKKAKIFRAALQELRASVDEPDKQILYAQIASNRFACFVEEISGNAGWSTTMEAQDGSRETISPVVNKLSAHADAVSALKESVKALQAAALFDPVYGIPAVENTLHYQDVLPTDYEGSYVLLANAKVIYCEYQRPKGAKQDWSLLCKDAKSLQMQLIPKLDKSRRGELDARSAEWAHGFAQHANYRALK